MKYFDVFEERVSGAIEETVVNRDGSWGGNTETLEDETSVVIGYKVWEYGEDGQTLNTVYYTVHSFDGVDNSDEVLAQIEADHPAGEWQNDRW